MKRLLLGFAILALAGCGAVVSEHPASEPADSRPDERLLGIWRMDRAASGEKDEEGKHKSELLVGIGKLSGSEPGLEFVLLLFDEEGKVGSMRDEVRATTIGGKPYLSVHTGKDEASPEAAAEPKDDKAGWFILRYDLSPEGVLRVLSMDVPTVAKDVKEKKIAGVVPTPSPGSSPESVTIQLSASTAALRAWLESRGEALFKADKPLVLKRLGPN